MERIALDERLSSAASMVRQGAVFADIGTDHAFLPVFLLEEGRVSRAVAADVAAGPLARAEKTVREHGLASRVTLLLADGFGGMESLGITDAAVCGMGGETIAAILDRAPFLRDPRVRLILQPMTKAAHLRRYLAGAGFAVVDEDAVFAAGRFYFCMAAEYTGAPYPLSREEAELGKINLARGGERFAALVRDRYRKQQKVVRGLALGGREREEEERYLAFLRKWTETDEQTGTARSTGSRNGTRGAGRMG